MVLVAIDIWLGRFSLLTGAGDPFDGANYTDVNASIPARGILAGISIVVALMFISVIFRPDWRVPFIGAGLMIVSALVVGGAYPAIVQRFQVDPNAQQFEAQYIQRNIDATRFADRGFTGSDPRRCSDDRVDPCP
jgi:uncharacterized protein